MAYETLLALTLAGVRGAIAYKQYSDEQKRARYTQRAYYRYAAIEEHAGRSRARRLLQQRLALRASAGGAVGEQASDVSASRDVRVQANNRAFEIISQGSLQRDRIRGQASAIKNEYLGSLASTIIGIGGAAASAGLSASGAYGGTATGGTGASLAVRSSLPSSYRFGASAGGGATPGYYPGADDFYR